MDFRILAVDDAPENLSFIVSTLKDSYRLSTAKDGASAIKISNSDLKPDLILLDVLMDGMDGFETCKALKKNENTKDIPIIFLTVLGESCDIEKGFELGGVDYVIKPFEPSVLRARVKTHCELAKKRKDLFALNAGLEALVESRTIELRELSENLQRRVEEETLKNLEKSRVMAARSKLADMGEMISAIAHRWRQPLNAVGIMIQDVRMAYEYGELDLDYLVCFERMAMSQLNFLSKTIEDFRSFFKIDKDKVVFLAQNMAKSAISLVGSQFEAAGVKFLVIERAGVNGEVFGYPNELKQVILNLFSNAKDAIKARKESCEIDFEGVITVTFENVFYDGLNYFDIEVKDNGIGVKAEIADRIFEPYFSSKGEGEGVGIGLYMAKTIIENSFKGKIYQKDSGDGAIFCISIPSRAT